MTTLRDAVLSLACLGFLVGGSPAWATALEDCAELLRYTGAPEYLGSEIPAHTYLCRAGYVLSHNDARKTPDWVIEVVVPEHLKGSADREGIPFRRDPDLAREGKGARPEDYVGSGFDRGHMAPAADMKWNRPAMIESFFMSNMSPQTGIGLNRAIWARLEAAVREWADAFGLIVAISGPIYDDGARSIGDSGVAVPAGFYKIVYQTDRRRAVAFLLPNRRIPHNDFARFIVPITEIEQQTGIDFLTGLTAREQRRIKGRKGSLIRAQ